MEANEDAYTINTADLLFHRRSSVTGLQAANGVLTDNEDGTYDLRSELQRCGVDQLLRR